MQTSLPDQKSIKFISPTKGELDFDQVIYDIADYILAEPKGKYQVVVGTDSPGKLIADFITAIVVRRIGKGGRYFWHRSPTRTFHAFLDRQRIYQEVTCSLDIAQTLSDGLKQDLKRKVNLSEDLSFGYHFSIAFEVHIDVGENGGTRDMIREVMGMVRGYGFEAKTKPESYGASVVADRHT